MKKSNQAYHENFRKIALDGNEELTFRLKSTTDQITRMVQELDKWLDKSKCCSSREKSEILTALSEALANAIIHGNKNDPDKIVDLKIRRQGNQLQILVQDQGKGFAPQKLADPTKPENLRRKNGRGIYLMKIFMDDVKLQRTKKGMKVIMKKKLSAREK
ncbi:MAG: ATP-binding protein [Calditrichaeota bacterium]|nr:ATP-binding protein [Calditrichota bacterium]